MLRTCKPSNPMVRFSKYKFNSKLLSGVTLFIITTNVTWTQPYIYLGVDGEAFLSSQFCPKHI